MQLNNHNYWDKKRDAVERKKKQQPEFQRSGKEGTNLLVFFSLDKEDLQKRRERKGGDGQSSGMNETSNFTFCSDQKDTNLLCLTFICK